jgi:RES domain-containing protein
MGHLRNLATYSSARHSIRIGDEYAALSPRVSVADASQALLQTVKQWPSDIYDVQAVIVAVLGQEMRQHHVVNQSTELRRPDWQMRNDGL